MRRMRTSGQIAKLFYEADNSTIIRKPNLRKFAKDSGIFYRILHNKNRIIDLDEFLAKVNPAQIEQHIEMPRLRNIISSIELFNATHAEYCIDRHTIEKCLKNDSVSKIKHGNRWVINYDELEAVLLEVLEVAVK